MNDDDKTVLIAYGSNVSSVQLTASQVFALLVKNLAAQELIVNKFSRLWYSKAWPDPSAPPYYNAVIQITTELPPRKLLALLHELERMSGRDRSGERYAPRILDLDLIAYGRQVLNESGLIVPHPRAQDRAFVMGPIADILPDWQHPVLGQTAAALYRSATVGRDAYPLKD